MRYLIKLKKTNKIVHEFYCMNSHDARLEALRYLRGWGLKTKDYTLLEVGI